LNAIVPRFERYADTGPIDRDAAIAVAVLTAARDAIVGADPGAQAATVAWYAAAIAGQAGVPGSSGPRVLMGPRRIPQPFRLRNTPRTIMK